MNRFRWVSSHAIEPECDLRRCGWQMAADGDSGPDGDCVTVADFARMQPSQWIGLIGCAAEASRRTILLYGVSNSRERARCLALGFGDVVPRGIGIDEVEARADRILSNTGMIPVRRDFAGLVLDLMARDASISGKRAGLHPREFALLWRLSETPDIPVAKRDLFADVWKTRHVPDTNSLAVHIFRLRAKLAIGGLGGVIATTDDGGYYLDCGAIARSLPRTPVSAISISTARGAIG